MAWVIGAVLFFAALAWAASGGTTQGMPPSAPTTTLLPPASLNLACGIGPNDADVRGVVHATATTEPHC